VADAFPAQPQAASIISIAPAVDAQRGAVEVKLALDGAAPDFLREDMTLSVEAVTGERENALVLPLAALQAPVRAAGSKADTSAADPSASAAGAQVMIVEGGKARARSVTLGLRSLSTVEVLTGLQPGERVLTAPVADGQRVRAVVAVTPAPGR
jgi:HlyD family secretion protein